MSTYEHSYRYQIFCSDIGGQDISAHHDQVETAITAVRDWLRTARKTDGLIPGGRRIAERYLMFRRDLPATCKAAGLDQGVITFLDFRAMVTGWLDENEW